MLTTPASSACAAEVDALRLQPEVGAQLLSRPGVSRSPTYTFGGVADMHIHT